MRREMRACRRAAENEICRVCNDKAHGYHFGVMACRACTAFFRRTVALNMHYECRHKNTCNIDKTVRNMCRSCRRLKCLRVGMKTESVQSNPDNIKNRKESSSTQSILSISSSASTSNSNILTELDDTEKQVYSRVNSILDDAIHNPRTSSDLTSLERFRLGMIHLRKRRQVIHTERFVDFEPFYGTDDFVSIFRENWEKFSKMTSREIDLHAELLSFIPDFITLPTDQRWILFKQFSISFMRFERAYDTYRLWGDDLNELRDVSFNGQPFEFMEALLHEKHRFKDSIEFNTLTSVFNPARTIMQKALITPIKEWKPTEIEFSLLSLHLLWLHPCNDNINDETLQIVTMNRRKIFDEIHDYYYVSMGIANYASRLGDFMSLMSVLEKSVFQKKENIMIADVFSLVKISPTLMSLTR